MAAADAKPFILSPPEDDELPYSRYPSLKVPLDTNYLMLLMLFPLCVFGLWKSIGSFVETRREIARSAYTRAQFVEARRRPGICIYTLEFKLADGRMHRVEQVIDPGKRGCQWSEGERVRLRYVRDNPDRIRLLEPSDDWTITGAIVFGLFIGSFTFIPSFIGTGILAVQVLRWLILRLRGRPLPGVLLDLEVMRHRSKVRYRGDGANYSRTWVESCTLTVSYRIDLADGREIFGKHELMRKDSDVKTPPAGTPLVIWYASPRLHRAL